MKLHLKAQHQIEDDGFSTVADFSIESNEIRDDFAEHIEKCLELMAEEGHVKFYLDSTIEFSDLCDFDEAWSEFMEKIDDDYCPPECMVASLKDFTPKIHQIKSDIDEMLVAFSAIDPFGKLAEWLKDKDKDGKLVFSVTFR